VSFSDVAPPVILALLLLVVSAATISLAKFPSPSPPSSDSPTPTATTTRTGPPTPTSIPYSIVTTWPHNPEYFTEGLEFLDNDPDTLIESTGLVGKSVLVKYRPMVAPGEIQNILARAEMTGGDLFGEGVTLFDKKLWWWSWQTGLGFTWV
jgi:glutamine cyclotransferase